MNGCFSPSEKIKKSFNVIELSIDKKNQIQERELANLYDTILKSKPLKNKLVEMADTIYLQTKFITEHIEIIRAELFDKDTVGDNLDNSTKLLVNTKTGKGLYKELKHFYQCAKTNLINEDLRKNIDSLSIEFPDNLSEKKWLEYNFEKIPTIAATTLLSKYQNDCIVTGEILLLEIRNEIKK